MDLVNHYDGFIRREWMRRYVWGPPLITQAAVLRVPDHISRPVFWWSHFYFWNCVGVFTYISDEIRETTILRFISSMLLTQKKSKCCNLKGHVKSHSFQNSKTENQETVVSRRDLRHWLFQELSPFMLSTRIGREQWFSITCTLGIARLIWRNHQCHGLTQEIMIIGLVLV